jgi:gas vesicle structural protein
MAVERVSGGSSLIDVLDRVLDKGMVIDAWVRISLVGIDLITVEARVVVASIETYLRYADAVGLMPTISRPKLTAGEEGGGEEEGEKPVPAPRPRRPKKGGGRR